MFVDIHNHIIFDSDDGAKDLEESLYIIDSAVMNNVSCIVATPHFRYGMFETPRALIDERYMELKDTAKQKGVDLLLGCEYHVNSEMISDIRCGKVHTLCDGNFILCEFSHLHTSKDVFSAVQKLQANGFEPVIAHAERLECVVDDPGLCGLFRESGALIQLDADGILGLDGKLTQKTCKRILKAGDADIVASDTHGRRRDNHMSECFTYISRKYSEEYARKLFINNPSNIIPTGVREV